MSDDAALEMVNAVLETAREPVHIGRSPRRCSTSIGLATFPHDGNDPATLFKAADIALYHAKSLGRDRAEIFNNKLRESVELRSSLLGDIENALIRNEFELFYQPIVPTDTTRQVSLEALMRWRHPKHGVVSPAHFQIGFEHQPTAAALGMFMLEQAFKDALRLRTLGVQARRIAINLTNADFRSDLFIDRFFELSQETGVPPRQFCVEVTEGMFLGRDQRRVNQGLQRLHEAGVEVAFDDFGTGFASLTHLRQMPIDRLKIDRSFIANIESSSADQAIVEGIVLMTHKMGKRVVAEGVENRKQMEILLSMDCDFLQGWLFGKACSVDELPELINTMSRDEARPLRCNVQ
ncbi:hypothetical protein ACO34A_23085 (plasmid) [Rhizobium sp. ACO-34A]|nr:hypothetical protein ACO34A_23085 [Rhizobium sp. ACO-34A]